MSWFKGLTGETVEPYVEPADTQKVDDPFIPNRKISTKQANKPFLSYQRYKSKQEKLHNDWLERQRIRDKKIARGEDCGPEEADPTAEVEIGFFSIAKFFVYVLLFGALAGKFVTGSYLWEYEGKWAQLKTYMPANQRLFSEHLLSEFDGSRPGRPIYLAIDGDVYDVTKGNSYKPGGSYHILVGVDAARAFATGCFKTHRTHDLRGLTEKELKSVGHWKEFYANHKDYFKVGRVSHQPIDPSSPIPEPCNPKTGESISSKKDTNERVEATKKKDEASGRDEL